MSESKRSRFLRFIGYAIPILLVVYVLSIGPVAAILQNSEGEWLKQEYLYFANFVYSPITLIALKSPFLLDLLGEYQSFWRQIL